MMFEYKKYYEYIQILEIEKKIIYIILSATGFTIGAFWGILGIILGICIGLIFASIVSLKIKVQIQKMKWEIDIYNMIRNIEKKYKE